MDNIQNWFEEQKGSITEKNEVIDKVISGITRRGFDSSHLNQLIRDKLENIASNYESAFNHGIEDEN